jgi:hypothetical protein
MLSPIFIALIDETMTVFYSYQQNNSYCIINYTSNVRPYYRNNLGAIGVLQVSCKATVTQHLLFSLARNQTYEVGCWMYDYDVFRCIL